MKNIIITGLYFLTLHTSINANAVEQGEFSLSGLITKAIDYHPSVKSRLFLEDSAKSNIRTAQWQYFPTPELSARGIKNSSSDLNYRGDDHALTFSLTQPLWAGGALDASLRRTRADLLMAQESTRVSKRELALQVVDAYSQWYASYLKKESFQRSTDEHESLQGRIKRRIKEGLSTGSDLELVNSRLNQTKASLNSANIELENSLLNLNELLGESLNTESLTRDFIGVSFNGDEQRLSRRALFIDPGLRQIKAESLSVKAEMEQSSSESYPRVNLKLERQWGNLSYENVSPENRVFLEVSSSFGAGLSRLSKNKGIKNRYQSLQVRIAGEKTKIEKQIALDWISSVSLKKQQELLGSSLVSLQKIRASWYRQFLAGRKTWHDVMNSTREVSQLEAQLANVYAAKILNDWRLLVRVRGVDALADSYVNSVQFSRVSAVKLSEKTLGHSSMTQGSKEATSAQDKFLNFMTPSDPIEKIIWYSRIESNPLSFMSIKRGMKRSFIQLMDILDKEDTEKLKPDHKESNNDTPVVD